MDRRPIILRNLQSPGDVLVLTAAVRDLHKLHPGKFGTAIVTSAAAIWENNPFVQELDASEAEIVDCRYPLIHKSNSGSWHFIHAFHHFLSEHLGVRLEPQELRGDIHLSSAERRWMSRVQEVTHTPVPFWIIVSGGKFDFTAKWFDPTRLQAVVDHFQHKILFAQVGEIGHHHPPLRRVLDLRGNTDLRQYIRLMHHAQGALCPITFTMHLAAATPTRGKCSAYPQGMPQNRPCVVIAGGREPSNWEAYPFHQFIHTNGALRCCANGGCWKSRVVPLGDGSDKDKSLCHDVLELDTGIRRSGRAWGALGATQPGFRFGNELANGALAAASWQMSFLPQCLNLISADEIIRRIQLYFDGGVVHYLTEAEARTCAEAIPSLGWDRRNRPLFSR